MAPPASELNVTILGQLGERITISLCPRAVGGAGEDMNVCWDIPGKSQGFGFSKVGKESWGTERGDKQGLGHNPPAMVLALVDSVLGEGQFPSLGKVILTSQSRHRRTSEVTQSRFRS